MIRGLRRIGARTTAVCLAFVILIATGSPLFGNEGESGGDGKPGQKVRVPEAHYTDTGAEGCMRCHAGDSMAVILETAHGDRSNPLAPLSPDQAGCEACHGPGSLHVSRSRGGAGFPPLARFGRGGESVPEQLGLCLDCHGQTLADEPGMAWRGSLHDTGRMTCSTCHQIHSSENVLSGRDVQIEKCAACHDKQIEEHPRFEGRGIVYDRLTCHDCHDVHQLVRRQ